MYFMREPKHFLGTGIALVGDTCTKDEDSCAFDEDTCAFDEETHVFPAEAQTFSRHKHYIGWGHMY